jgi:hypothetical protein
MPAIIVITPVNLNNTPVNLNNTPVNLNNTPVNLNNTPANLNNTPANLNNTPANLNNNLVTRIAVAKMYTANNKTLGFTLHCLVFFVHNKTAKDDQC